VYRLRAWEPSDADRLLEAFAADPGMARQAPVVPRTARQAAVWIVERADRAREGRAFGFAVTDGDGPVLGHVEIAVKDRCHDTGWVSYWTHPAARGRGVAAAGAGLVADHAFTALDLFRLELGHRIDNPGSCSVARRAGFRPEGVERSRLRYGTERFDVGTHARLVTDPPGPVGGGPCAA
jgi:RimJ/RimL family protein N-acetyltransferase